MSAVEDLLLAHVRDCREKIAAAVSSVDALETLAARLGNLAAAAPTERAYRVDDWSKEEDELIRVHYPELGSGCHELMPHRTKTAIRTRAHRLGIITQPSSQRLFCEQCQVKVTRGQIASCKSPYCDGKKQVASGA